VRYWVSGEDENYERELERVSRFGGAPMLPSNVAVLVLLVCIQAVLFTTIVIVVVSDFTSELVP
jgi:hypothetical protein